MQELPIQGPKRKDRLAENVNSLSSIMREARSMTGEDLKRQQLYLDTVIFPTLFPALRITLKEKYPTTFRNYSQPYAILDQQMVSVA